MANSNVALGKSLRCGTSFAIYRLVSDCTGEVRSPAGRRSMDNDQANIALFIGGNPNVDPDFPSSG